MLDISATVHKHLPKVVAVLPKPLLSLFIITLKKIFHEKQFLDIYAENKHLQGVDFADSMLEKLDITYTVKPNELYNIPATGRVIIIANHLMGAQETMSLMQTVSNSREDKKIKLLANTMLMGIKQISNLLIPVDNINGAITKESLKQLNEALEREEAIIIFPAGVVSRFTRKGIKDVPWKASFLKVARKTQTPILPIRVNGRNSILFYALSLLLPKRLTGLLLPHEFATASKRKKLHLTIGQVIPTSSFSDPAISVHEYVTHFYNHLYGLGTKKVTFLQTETTIGKPQNKKQLKEEVEKAQFLGYTNNGKKIILAQAEDAPFLIRELGRVRELSFRAIGGGTGRARDNDMYDNYYKHLILWDDHDLEIVGAYRIGECKEIINDKGIEGLYTSNLCSFNEYFQNYYENSIELGRSFVQPKYWGTRAFDNLWQAITVYLAHNPHIQYSYGVVTINADTPQKAVAALVYFYTHHFACTTQMMTAKTPYILSEKNKKEFDNLFKDLPYKEGFFILKKYLKDLGTTVPTLFKQYIELYEAGAVRYFDFSVNEGLFGVTEGFIIADNYRMKKSVQERNLKKFYESKTTDTLTSLYTRNHFSSLVKTMNSYQRNQDVKKLLGIVMIDDFSSVHSEYGLVSDKVIQKVATVLKKQLRESDIIAKYSIERFAIILSDTREEESFYTLEKLRASLDGLRINGSFTISCSIVATQFYFKADKNILSHFDVLEKYLDDLTESSHVAIL